MAFWDAVVCLASFVGTIVLGLVLAGRKAAS